MFKNSALVSEIKGQRDFLNWKEQPFTLKINGEVRQESKLSNAIMQVDEMIHYIDGFFPICDGDLIFTGTPAGVGPLRPNDHLEMSFGPILVNFKLVDNG